MERKRKKRADKQSSSKRVCTHPELEPTAEHKHNQDEPIDWTIDARTGQRDVVFHEIDIGSMRQFYPEPRYPSPIKGIDKSKRPSDQSFDILPLDFVNKMRVDKSNLAALTNFIKSTLLQPIANVSCDGDPITITLTEDAILSFRRSQELDGQDDAEFKIPETSAKMETLYDVVVWCSWIMLEKKWVNPKTLNVNKVSEYDDLSVKIASLLGPCIYATHQLLKMTSVYFPDLIQISSEFKEADLEWETLCDCD